MSINYKKFNVFDKEDTRNFIHFHVTAPMPDAVKMDIICINRLVREGKSYKEIANIMDGSFNRTIKPTDVKRLHYGYAPNAYLSPWMKKEVADSKPKGWIDTPHYELCAIREDSQLDSKWEKSKGTKMVTGLFYNSEDMTIIDPDKCPDNMPIPIMNIKIKRLSRIHTVDSSIKELPPYAKEHNQNYGKPDGTYTYELGTFECYHRVRYVSRSMCRVYAMYQGACCHINR